MTLYDFIAGRSPENKMKEIIVVKAENCPFYDTIYHCNLDPKLEDCAFEDNNCPLFENDYLIKRRKSNV